LLVASDFDGAAGHAFDLAVQLASRIPGSRLHVAHVVDRATPEEEVQRLGGLLRLYVSEKLSADRDFVHTVGIHVRGGDLARELAQLAADVDADAIVLGAPAHILGSLLHETLAARVQSAARCPVLVAPPQIREAAERVEPVIEPPCAECAVARQSSNGSTWCCANHDTPMRRAHRYSYQVAHPFSSHDYAVNPVADG
jgi:nucleotide-binding universal stress UspA family protein